MSQSVANSNSFQTLRQKLSYIKAKAIAVKDFFKKVNVKVVAAILLFWGFLFFLVFLKDTRKEYPFLRAPLQGTTLSDLHTYIHLVNIEQVVYNKDKKGSSTDLVIVIKVHDNFLHLQQLITSLAQTPNIENTLLIFSHDRYEPVINQLIANVTFAKSMQIFYPFSIQTHRGEFPGPSMEDYTEMTWRNASQAQERHHWWWRANFVFNRIRILADYRGLVLFLEEDDYLKQDFLHCLYLMSDYIDNCPKCWFFALAAEEVLHNPNPKCYNVVLFRKTLETFGLAFNRTIWNRISTFGESFCKFNDYSWSRSLKYLVKDVIKSEVLTMTLASPRLYRGTFCNTECRVNFENSLFPEFLETKELLEFTDDKIENEGGWSDPRDHALCMGM